MNSRENPQAEKGPLDSDPAWITYIQRVNDDPIPRTVNKDYDINQYKRLVEIRSFEPHKAFLEAWKINKNDSYDIIDRRIVDADLGRMRSGSLDSLEQELEDFAGRVVEEARPKAEEDAKKALLSSNPEVRKEAALVLEILEKNL